MSTVHYGKCGKGWYKHMKKVDYLRFRMNIRVGSASNEMKGWEMT
jgi:hypothetical protein